MTGSIGDTLTGYLLLCKEDHENLRLEKGYIILSYGGYEYDIALERLSTPSKILSWMRQLSGKKWMNAHRLNLFCQLAFNQIGIEPDNNI